VMSFEAISGRIPGGLYFMFVVGSERQMFAISLRIIVRLARSRRILVRVGRGVGRIIGPPR
jgi:hypothetical protein